MQHWCELPVPGSFDYAMDPGPLVTEQEATRVTIYDWTALTQRQVVLFESIPFDIEP